MKRGLGISTGSGIIYYPDNTLEVLGKPVEEFILKDGKHEHTLLLPSKRLTFSS